MINPTQITTKQVYWKFFCNYFFQFASLGVLLPLFGVYLRELGFTGIEIGLLVLSLPALQMISSPISSYLADTRLPRLWIYRFTLIGAVLITPAFYVAKSFVQLFFVIAIYGMMRMPNTPMINAAALEYADEPDFDYSRLRIGGSIGFMIFAAIAGWWVGHFGFDRIPDWLMFAVVGQLIVGWNLPMNKAQIQSANLKAVRAFLAQPAWVIFLVGILFSRMGEAAYNVFYSVHVTDLNFSPKFAGQLWAIGVLSEVIVLLFAKRLLSNVNIQHAILGTYLISALRWLGIALATSVWQLVALQSLHGITFGLFYVAVVQWAHIHSPENLKTSAQGMSHAIMFGIAGIVGQTLGGLFYDLGGSQVVFYGASAMAFVALSVSLFLIFFEKKSP